MKEALTNINWFDVVPSTMSAIAAIAASVAAFYSLRVSKQSIEIAESTALANHHHSATLRYYETIQEVYKASKELNEVCYHLYVDWASQIENYDHRLKGGKNPRPLRHVIGNAKDMLVSHSTRYHRLSDGIFSTVVGGMGEISNIEYQKLLKKADNTYHNFEETFGIPSKSSPINSADAFRWTYYQMIKRVSTEDWGKVWKHAWSEKGWVTKYCNEYDKAKSTFEKASKQLQDEKAKLSHTPLPLERNVVLHKKYSEAFTMLQRLEDCSPERIEDYKDYPFENEFCLLILCAMSTAQVARKQLSEIEVLANY